MAGLDRMYDACAFIQEYIEIQIRELLEDPMNEYQDPNWVQATLLFERVVIPCEEYIADGLFDLANDIVEKAEKYSRRAIYQRIPGMYNEKIVEADSIDMNNLSDDIRAEEYDTNIEKIKK
ncbi:MAG: hypothetical protein CEE43_01840 [Promethearchaeota archaeon Loki_b32]|nr:MAG: hypothetical protein CEE43_01840 [Candidatus Lokiarchaeota archaeon Loki_b32]